MSEDKKLDFSLPERAPAAPAKSGVATWLVVFLILLVGANLYLTWSARNGGEQALRTNEGLPAGNLKKLALKLEKQGLSDAAAGTWLEYLNTAEDVDAGAIWYRIGTLHQEAGSHEQALLALYRAESLGCEGFADEIGRRVRESLESLGKFAALKHELTERVSLDADAAGASDDVVAEIGPQKITRAELDRRMEAMIDSQLAMMAGQLSAEQRKQQKEAMLKQLSTDQQRLQMLNGFIVEEILYRRARESKLVDDPEVRARLRDAERGLLARQVMESEMRDKVNITDGDISTYYEANKQNYVDPESAKLSQILVADEETAKELIGKLTDGGDFATLAGEHSGDAASKEKGGEIAAPLTKGGTIPGIAVAAEAWGPVFAVEAGGVLAAPLKSEAGYHVIKVRECSPERQRPFDEVRQQVYQELRGRKEREVQEQLLNSLRDEYDVVIHQEAFAGAAASPSDK